MNEKYVEIIGLMAGFCTTVSFIPQVMKIWKSRSAEGVSLGMYMIFCSGVAFWIAYGVLIGSLSVILANAFTLVFSISVLVMKLTFK